ncbi:MAG: hypothetical protein PHU46_07900 [Rhodocyclaceae bacterium]|nr:hypothetical protein [Rhodocyclaceae bacterium]
MVDLTKGYLGNGNGSCEVLDEIINHPSLNINMPGDWLAKELFLKNFMPYANVHWPYHGGTCDCQALSQTLTATWDYIRFKRGKDQGELPKCDVVWVREEGYGNAIIAKSLPMVGHLAHGNIRVNGMLDGRALFPNHWLCRIGTVFYDPTYDRIAYDKTDCVERYLTRKLTEHLWLDAGATGLPFIYARDEYDRPAGFSEAWHELKGTGWISAADWKIKTARDGFHSRSLSLDKVDTLLKAFEDQGYPRYEELKAAFTNWAKNNPKEAKSRDVDHCVRGLARFLGVDLMQLGVGII